MPTGIAVAKGAAGTNLTRATLELGAKNAVAFLDDIATDKAVAAIIEAAFLHTGKICAWAERFYVPRARLDEIVDAIGQSLRTSKIGSPLGEAAQLGPATNKPHRDKLAGYFRPAKADGNGIAFGQVSSLSRP